MDLFQSHNTMLPSRWQRLLHSYSNWVVNRAVESKSLKLGKSLKIEKNRIKSEKSELIFYQTFLDFLEIIKEASYWDLGPKKGTILPKCDPFFISFVARKMPALRFMVKICLNLPLKFSEVLRLTDCCSRKSFFLNAYNFGTRGPTQVRRISK